jgi:DNA-binding MarR family transcriptional regulator
VGDDFRSSAEAVAGLLADCHRLLEQFRGEFLGRYELTVVRYRVLEYLHQAGPIGRSQAAVAEELQQAESSVCTLVERMRGDGLIYRHRCKHDRRKRILLLTEQGRDVRERVARGYRDYTAALLAVITAGRQKLLGELLAELADGLRHRCGAAAGTGATNTNSASVPVPHFVAGADEVSPPGAAMSGETETAVWLGGSHEADADCSVTQNNSPV